MTDIGDPKLIAVSNCVMLDNTKNSCMIYQNMLEFHQADAIQQEFMEMMKEFNQVVAEEKKSYVHKIISLNYDLMTLFINKYYDQDVLARYVANPDMFQHIKSWYLYEMMQQEYLEDEMSCLETKIRQNKNICLYVQKLSLLHAYLMHYLSEIMYLGNRNNVPIAHIYMVWYTVIKPKLQVLLNNIAKTFRDEIFI